MTIRTEVVELLLDLEPTDALPEFWHHVDRSPLTPTELALLESATWPEFQAARDLLAADLDHERTELTTVDLALLAADLDREG